MATPECHREDCETQPRWVRCPDNAEDAPVYLCTRHWNELRILAPDQAYLYVPIQVAPDDDVGARWR